MSPIMVASEVLILLLEPVWLCIAAGTATAGYRVASDLVWHEVFLKPCHAQ